MHVERQMIVDVTRVTARSTYSGGGVFTVCPRCHQAIEIRLRRSIR
jgi:hypothetical protein